VSRSYVHACTACVIESCTSHLVSARAAAGHSRALIHSESVATSAEFTGATPLNLHQAANYYCCVKADVPLRMRLFFAGLSVFLVALQVVVSASLMWGSAHPTCVRSSQCGFDRACIFQRDGRQVRPLGLSVCPTISSACPVRPERSQGTRDSQP
jgi:hypothetical protein